MQAIFCRQIQTGTVAACQQFPIFLLHGSVDNRPNRVQYMAAGQIVAFGNFCLSGFFLVSLLAHDFSAFQTKLHPGIGVNGIVDAAMTGHKTA